MMASNPHTPGGNQGVSTDHILPGRVPMVVADAALVAHYRRLFRLFPDEELHATKSDAEWRIELAGAEADDWPEDVTLNSLIDALSVTEAVAAELAWRQEKGVGRGPVEPGIPVEFIGEVKARNPIEDVIGDVVDLSPTATGFKGCCPFHADDTPSLHIRPKTGRFICFGCQVRGDALVFVQLQRSTSFIDAVAYLAERAGMATPEHPFARPRRRRNSTGMRIEGGRVVWDG